MECLDWLLGFFWKDLDIEVNLTREGRRGKTVAVASNAWLAHRAEPALRRRGVRLVPLARNLGVDHRGAGSRAKAGQTTAGARMATAIARMRLVMRAKQRGASAQKVAKLGLKPSVTFGWRARGMPPTAVRKLRRMVGNSLPGRRGGRSLSLKLVVHSEEVAHACAAAPLAGSGSVTNPSTGRRQEMQCCAAAAAAAAAAAENGAARWPFFRSSGWCLGALERHPSARILPRLAHIMPHAVALRTYLSWSPVALRMAARNNICSRKCHRAAL